MLNKALDLPPALRAILATLAASAGLSLSGNNALDLAIVLGWLFGGIAEIVRDVRARRQLSVEDVSRKLQEAAEAAARGGGVALVVLAAAGPFLVACGGVQSEDLAVRTVRATCEAEVIFERDSVPIGVLVRPSIVEGSGESRTAVVCVSYGPFVACDELDLAE